MTAKACHYCGATDRETRPYGPGASSVCFPCATATPEREQRAAGAYLAQLEAVAAVAPGGVVVIGTEDGPTVP